MISSHKNKNDLIIYSLSSHSKPVYCCCPSETSTYFVIFIFFTNHYQSPLCLSLGFSNLTNKKILKVIVNFDRTVLNHLKSTVGFFHFLKNSDAMTLTSTYHKRGQYLNVLQNTIFCFCRRQSPTGLE